MAHRAVIEQAKGALMLRYGFDPDGAFAVLRRWSQQTNIKARDLADAFTQEIRAGRQPLADTNEAMDWLRQQLPGVAEVGTIEAFTTQPDQRAS